MCVREGEYVCERGGVSEGEYVCERGGVCV